ncbi:thioredoxin [Paenibacillus sp. CAA11]|uniref:thioredoxin family protein n=1 Tax=Paenibacillus sp. CAA11 TaxID=1532905 RepID=UPI000D3D7F52|nr:thioredoxin family protein [Paenibacillus sp. CAA11]AWB43102.1 thioredoxin [Paenibacillus sp. CAA11]
MPLLEITEPQLLQILDETSVDNRQAVLFYTAFCGTCKLGERMLEIVEATGKSMPISKININYAPQLREKWKIASVPCLVVLEGEEPAMQEYAMRSVDHLYALLQA